MLFLRFGASAASHHVGVLLLFDPLRHQRDGQSVLSVANLAAELDEIEFTQVRDIGIEISCLYLDTDLSRAPVTGCHPGEADDIWGDDLPY